MIYDHKRHRMYLRDTSRQEQHSTKYKGNKVGNRNTI